MHAVFTRSAIATVGFVAIACGGPKAETNVSPQARVAVPEGTVAINVSQTGANCKPENRCAETEALRTLMFVGVPGSSVPRAIVADEAGAMRKHAVFFRQLFEQGGHARYITGVSRVQTGAGAPANTTAWTVVVNYEALRIALEKEGVIRKFGY